MLSAVRGPLRPAQTSFNRARGRSRPPTRAAALRWTAGRHENAEDPERGWSERRGPQRRRSQPPGPQRGQPGGAREFSAYLTRHYVSDYGDGVLRASWTGAEWQAHCRELLAMKHAENVQFIPDRDRGDGGLEGYRIDKPIVYQCYAAQDAYDVASLTEAQKGKIRDDIKKLSDDLARTQRILGPDFKVERWVLLTPYFDSKELVIYARSKSITTRKAPCPKWCHPEIFEIVIHTDELFAAERASLLTSGRSKLHLDVRIPTSDEVRDQAGQDVENKLQGKLLIDPGLAASTSDLENYLVELLLDYVRGNEQKRYLASEYTSLFFTVRREADAVLRGLTRFMAARRTDGLEAVEDLTARLAQRMANEAPGLSDSLCEDLARHYVAEWFIECPLRFGVAARSA